MTISSIGIPYLGGAAPAAAAAPSLPLPAERYQGSVPKHTRVHGADLATYRRVYGAMGAANSTLASKNFPSTRAALTLAVRFASAAVFIPVVHAERKS